jgi:hypothetical protein
MCIVHWKAVSWLRMECVWAYDHSPLPRERVGVSFLLKRVQLALLPYKKISTQLSAIFLVWYGCLSQEEV